MGVTKKVMTAEAIRAELADMEARYGMSSDEFYLKFNRGELGDDEDFFVWASLYDMLSRYEMPKATPA